MKSFLISAIAAVALSQNAMAADPAFHVTGTWQPASGGMASFFQASASDDDHLVNNQLRIINITGNFAHTYVGTWTPESNSWIGTQTRVNRTDGCSTEMRLTVTASSDNFVSISAKAKDSNCDLTKGQTFTDSATRIQ